MDLSQVFTIGLRFVNQHQLEPQFNIKPSMYLGHWTRFSQTERTKAIPQPSQINDASHWKSYVTTPQWKCGHKFIGKSNSVMSIEDIGREKNSADDSKRYPPSA